MLPFKSRASITYGNTMANQHQHHVQLIESLPFNNSHNNSSGKKDRDRIIRSHSSRVSRHTRSSPYTTESGLSRHRHRTNSTSSSSSGVWQASTEAFINDRRRTMEARDIEVRDEGYTMYSQSPSPPLEIDVRFGSCCIATEFLLLLQFDS